MSEFRKLLASGKSNDPGFDSMIGHYLLSESDRATQVRNRLIDLDERRIADMNATGIDRQVLALTSPGVQIFDADTASFLPYQQTISWPKPLPATPADSRG